MAADILLYKGTHVPVGDDQKQHLELTRDIAKKFNHDFRRQIKALGFDADYFPLTEPMITGPAMRVRSLRDGSKKMSKSEPSDFSRINMTDSADDIVQKIRKARTDAAPLPGTVEGLEERPEARNLIGIFAALADREPADVCAEFDGRNFSDFKEALAGLAIAKLSPIQDEMRRLMADPGHVDRVLADGAARARALAAPVLAEVQEIVGFLRA